MMRNAKAYRQQCHQEDLNATLKEVAELTGRLATVLELPVAGVQEAVCGTGYLTPWEKRERLLRAAAEAGV